MAATTAEKIAFHAANVARTAPRLEAPSPRTRATLAVAAIEDAAAASSSDDSPPPSHES